MSQISSYGVGGGPPGMGFIRTITPDAGVVVNPDGAQNVNITGAHGINTFGAGSTLTVQIDNTITLGDLAVVTAGNDALTITSGDITLSGTGVNAAANINLPNTNATGSQGVITLGTTRSFHNFAGGVGENIFVGEFAGNFTLTSGGNTGVGYQALETLSSGSNNTAIANQNII